MSRFDLRGTGAESLRLDDLLGLSGLRALDLGGNALRELPAALLSHSPRLRSLWLDGNHLESLRAPGALVARRADDSRNALRRRPVLRR